MCKNEFRFRIGEALTLIEVNPWYSSELNKDFEQESGQKFFREKLTGGKLTFVESDYDFIYDKPFAHQFRIQIDRLLPDGINYLNEWFVGEFTKTDCDFDEDRRTIEVTPKPFDKYKLLTDARNKEFNLVELSPDVDQLKVSIQPMIQIYSDLSGVLTNILSGVQFEQSISFKPVFFDDLLTIHKFNLIRTLLFIPGDDNLLNPDVSGEYQQNLFASNDNQFQLITINDVGFPPGPFQTDDPEGISQSNFIVPASTLTDDDFLSVWSAPNGNTFAYIGTFEGNGLKELSFRGLDGDSAPPTGILTHVSGAVNTTQLTYVNYDNSFYRWRWGMYHANPPVPFIQQYLFLAPMMEGLNASYSIEDGWVKRSALFSPINGSTGNFKVFGETILARVLTTAATFDGNATSDIPSQDIVSSHGLYTKVVGLNYDAFQLHDGNQVEFEKYGRFSDDAANYSSQYFTKPIPATTGQMIPLQISEWTEVSFWILYTPALQAIQNAGNTFYVISYAYKLSSLIKAFLKNIDPSLSYEEDADHSEFFFTENAIRGSIKTPMISPKSNIIYTNSEKPASAAKMRFADLETFLVNFYKVHWYIDDSNRFRTEFVDFFDRGLTYTGQNLNDDLTTLLESKTGKPWSYKDKKYKFEKSLLFEEIKHSWMDEVSLPFVGVPVKMISPYVEKGNFDERTLSIFTSDIDFIHSQSDLVAPDGFVFFEAVTVNDKFEVPFVEITIDGDVFNLQNGFASMFYASLQYWLYDLPSTDVNLNYEDRTALSVKKTKLQDIEYPSTNEPDAMKLIQSSLGIASIKKMTINLSTGSIKINLKHVTE